MKIILIGGGIGGLSTAIALQRLGAEAHVFEAAPEMRAVGAGLVLAANAMKAYDEMGIGAAIASRGEALDHLSIRDMRGRVLSQVRSSAIARMGGATHNFAIHRGDLQLELMAQLQPETLHTGKRLAAFGQDAHHAWAEFEDGTRATGDALIAADGLHSLVRKTLIPGSLPRYSGYTCWRIVTSMEGVAHSHKGTSETWGRHGRVGIVPLRNNTVYAFLCVNTKGPNDPVYAAWGLPELRRHFADFHAPIPQMLAAAKPEELLHNDISDIAPVKQYAFGRIALLGDAAHATTPNMGQGACQAIEDALAVARHLTGGLSVENALRTYEQQRIGKATRVVNTSWRIGQVAQWENPLLIALRNTAARLTSEQSTLRRMAFLFE